MWTLKLSMLLICIFHISDNTVFILNFRGVHCNLAQNVLDEYDNEVIILFKDNYTQRESIYNYLNKASRESYIGSSDRKANLLDTEEGITEKENLYETPSLSNENSTEKTKNHFSKSYVKDKQNTANSFAADGSMLSEDDVIKFLEKENADYSVLYRAPDAVSFSSHFSPLRRLTGAQTLGPPQGDNSSKFTWSNVWKAFLQDPQRYILLIIYILNLILGVGFCSWMCTQRSYQKAIAVSP